MIGVQRRLLTRLQRTRFSWADAGFLLAALAVSLLALWVRISHLDSRLEFDLTHFVRFSGVLFRSEHLDYYTWNLGAPDLYGHLPGFPYLLHPFLLLVRAIQAPDLYAIKGIIYAADFGSAIVLYVLARRSGLGRWGGLAIGSMWLFAGWVLDAGTVEGHPNSVASLFLLLAILRARVGWQAGALWAIAVTMRTEFAFVALAALLHYAVWRRDQVLTFFASSVAVFAAIVLPFVIRDSQAFLWGAFLHTQGRGDSLPVLRALYDVFGQELPDALRGNPDWSLRIMVPIGILLSGFDRDLPRALFKVGLVYALALPILHTRYLVMPLTVAMAYASRPRIVWALVVWFVVDMHGRLAPEMTWTLRLALTLFMYIGLPIRGLIQRVRPRAAPTVTA